MASLRDIFVRLGVKTDPNGIKRANAGLSKIISGAKAAAVAFAGLKAVQAMKGVADDTRVLGDRLDKVSQQVGVTTDALQELEFAGGLAGASADEMSTALRILSRNAREASEGSTEYAEDFAAIGVSVTDTNGKLKSADALLVEMSDGMSRLSSDTEKTALAQTLLGRSGSKLIPMLNQGSAAILAQRQEARDLGLMTKEEIRVAVELTDNQLRLSRAFGAIKLMVGKGLLPVFNRATKALTAFLRANREIIRERIGAFFSSMVRVLGSVKDFILRIAGSIRTWAQSLDPLSAKFLKLAGLAAALAVVMALPLAPVLLLMALIALLIDDFETWRKGGDSVIGDLIALFSELGARIAAWADETLDAIVGAWDGIVSAVGGAVGELVSIVEGYATAVTSTLSALSAWVEEHRTGISVVTSLVAGAATVYTVAWAKANARAIALFLEWHARTILLMVKVRIAAIRNALVTSAAWVKSSVVSSAAWLKTQVFLIPTYLRIAATAVASAATSAAAWVASAAASAAAWLVATAPLILTGLLLSIIVGTLIFLGRELYRLATGQENFFTTMWQGIQDLIDKWGGVGPAIWAMLQEALKFWLEFFGVNGKEVDTWIENLTDTLMSFWDNIIDHWSDVLGGWWDKWSNVIDFGFGGDDEGETDRRAEALADLSESRRQASAAPETVGERLFGAEAPGAAPGPTPEPIEAAPATSGERLFGAAPGSAPGSAPAPLETSPAPGSAPAPGPVASLPQTLGLPTGPTVGGTGMVSSPTIINENTENIEVRVTPGPGMDERRLAELTAAEIRRAREAETRIAAQSFATEAP